MPIVGKPQLNSFGEFTGYRGSAKDIRHSRTEAAANDRRTQVDTLTGLANKTQIKRSFSHNFRVFRNTKKSCAVLMINLDRFKQVNETLGQAADWAMGRACRSSLMPLSVPTKQPDLPHCMHSAG